MQPLQPQQQQPTPYSASLYSYAPLFAVPPAAAHAAPLYEAAAPPSRPFPPPQPMTQPPPPNESQVAAAAAVTQQQFEAVHSARSTHDAAASLTAPRLGGCCEECRAVIVGDQARDLDGTSLDSNLLDQLRDLQLDDPIQSQVAYSPPYGYFNRIVFKGYRIKWSFRQSLPLLVFDGPNEPQRISRAVISIGDGTARLHPWMRGASMPPSNEPEMRMLVMGENEPSFAFILLCTEQMFASIKAEQNLHVSFPAFTKRVVDLLTTVGKESPENIDSESIANERDSRFLVSLRLTDDIGTLSIVESTTFRSLTHVSLTLKRLSCCQLRILLASEVVLRQRYSRVLEVHASSLLHEAEDQRAKVDGLHARVALQKEEFRCERVALEEDAQHKLTEATKMYEALKTTLRTQQADVEAQYRAADKERLDLRLKVSEIQRHIITQEDWERQQRELKDAVKELTAERDAVALVAKREEETSQKMVELLKERAELKEQLAKLQVEGASKEETLSTLEERTRHLNSWKTKAKEAQGQVSELQTKLTGLEDQLDQARTTFAQTKIALEKRDSQVRQLEKDVEDLNIVLTATRADNQRLHNANMELNKRLTDSLVQMAKREQPDQFNSWAATGPTDDFSSLEPEEALFPEYAGPNAGIGVAGRARPPPRMMNSAPIVQSQQGGSGMVIPKVAATVGLTPNIPLNIASASAVPAMGPPPPAVHLVAPPSAKLQGQQKGTANDSDFLTHVPPPTPGSVPPSNTAIARPRGLVTSTMPGVNRTTMPPTRPPGLISMTPPPSRQSQPAAVAGRGSGLAAPKQNIRKRPPGPVNAFTIAQRGRTPQQPGGGPPYDDFAS